MRILFLARYINSSGVTNHMLTLGKHFKKNGHDVALMSGGVPNNINNKLYSFFNENGILILENGFPRNRIHKLLELTKYILTIPKSLYLIRKYKPDIIHVHWPITSYIAKIYQFIFKIPVLQTFHTGGTPKTLLHQKVDAVIAISSELEQEVKINYMYSTQDIFKIYNGVSRDEYLPNKELAIEFRDKLGIDNSEIIITFVGSLDKNKGLDVLLNAVKKVRTYKKVRLLIIGDGDKEWVEKLIRQNDLNGYVHIYSFQNPYSFYNISDIFVLPSRKEGFGLVVIEAMLMGVPVVRSNTEGARDQIVHGKEGFIFNSEDSDELSLYLNKLANNECLRKELGTKGRKKAELLFTSGKMSNETLQLYSYLINKKERKK